ncbi:MAG: DUF6662 family protein [Verrucomicrobiae bacterium]
MKTSWILGTLLLAGTAIADNRIFTYSYEPETEPKGDWELEQSITSRLTRNRAVGQENYQQWQFSTEVEHGVTDRYTVGLDVNDNFEHFYDPSTKNTTDVNRWAGVSLENRYQVLDPVENPVGLTLYLEPTCDGQNAELEQKIILGQRHGEWKWTVNLSHATEWTGDVNNYEGELELSAGLARNLTERWTLGLEVRDHNELPLYQQWENSAVYLGPTLSYHRQKWWAAFSVLPQIYGWSQSNPDQNLHLELEGHERLNLRLLVGYSF